MQTADLVGFQPTTLLRLLRYLGHRQKIEGFHGVLAPVKEYDVNPTSTQEGFKMGQWLSSLDSSWFHAMLLLICIAASLCVAIGIVLENPKWTIPNILVVGGVALEAVCTLLLFGFDEGISSAQQRKIIMLERNMASRPFDTAAFLARLKYVQKEPVRILYAASDPDTFQLAIFGIMSLVGANWIVYQDGPGIPVDIERCSPFGDVSIVSKTLSDEEVEDLKRPLAKRSTTLGTLLNALDDGLGKSGSVGYATCPSASANVLSIIVSKRLPPLPPK